VEPTNTTIDPIPCIGGCGEMYCSEKCRELAFSQYPPHMHRLRFYVTPAIYHHLLCVGQISSTSHPLYRFKQHALETNELFILASQLIARIISLWLEHGKQGRIIDFQTQVCFASSLCVFRY
jgi:hypothetical protein